MRLPVTLALPFVLTLLALLASCGPSLEPRVAPAWVPAATRPDDALVARVGEVSIYASEVEAQARRSGKTARAALDDLVRAELLALAARHRGLLDDTQVSETHKAALVERLIEKEFESRTRKQDLPDAEVRAVYERVKERFVHGRLVEIGVLSFYTGSRMKPAAEAKRAEAARELRLYIATHPPKTLEEHVALARDPAWVDRGLSYTRTLQSEDKPYSAELGRRVQALRRAGDVTDLIADEMGYHIARYISERPPENRSFEQVRDEIRDGLYEGWRANAFLRFSQQLAAGHKVEAWPDRLKAPASANP